MGNVLDKIKDIVDNRYGLDTSRVTKNENYIKARSIYYRIAKNNTQYSLGKIGKLVNKDHSTVYHAIKGFDRLIKNSPEDFKEYLICLETLRDSGFKLINTDQDPTEKISMINKIEDLEERVLKLDLQNKRLIDDTLRLSEGNIDSMFSKLIQEIPEVSKEIVKERLKAIVKMEKSKIIL